MIIKPRSLTSLSGRPECEGLVWAACPGIDIPYEMFTNQTGTATGSPSMIKESPYGYCFDGTGQSAPLLSFSHNKKLETIGNKFTVIYGIRPNAVNLNLRFFFGCPYSTPGTSPYLALAFGLNTTKLTTYMTTSTTTYQSIDSDTGLFAAGTWCVGAATRDGTAMNYWKNGDTHGAAKTLGSANNIAWGTGVVSIGGTGVASQYMIGGISFVYVYNRVLSHSEISLISAYPFILFDDGDRQFDYGAYGGVPPGAPTLDSPANGATGVALPPTFEWTAAA